MLFSLLMKGLVFLIKRNLKKQKYLRDMISVKNHKVVMTTKDGKHGARLILDNGEFFADQNLIDFDDRTTHRSLEFAGGLVAASPNSEVNLYVLIAGTFIEDLVNGKLIKDLEMPIFQSPLETIKMFVNREFVWVQISMIWLYRSLLVMRPML